MKLAELAAMARRLPAKWMLSILQNIILQQILVCENTDQVRMYNNSAS